MLLLALFVSLEVTAVGCGGGGSDQQSGQQQGKPAGEQGGKTGKKGSVGESKIAIGKVASVDAENKRIILDQFRGKQMSFKTGGGTRITLTDKQAELSDVKEGQQAQVRYTVRNGLNRAREVDVFSGGGTN
jgi:hypothetical protein